mgnify:CR=1 FL=1
MASSVAHMLLWALGWVWRRGTGPRSQQFSSLKSVSPHTQSACVPAMRKELPIPALAATRSLHRDFHVAMSTSFLFIFKRIASCDLTLTSKAPGSARVAPSCGEPVSRRGSACRKRLKPSQVGCPCPALISVKTPAGTLTKPHNHS